MLHWLRAPALPRPFVMDLLDFVLGNSAAVFRELPAFEHALLLRVCALLTTQLRNLLDPLCEPALQASDLRVTLRTVRTLLQQFHRQLRSKCGVFIETLLAGDALSGHRSRPPRPSLCHVTDARPIAAEPALGSAPTLHGSIQTCKALVMV